MKKQIALLIIISLSLGLVQHTKAIVNREEFAPFSSRFTGQNPWANLIQANLQTIYTKYGITHPLDQEALRQFSNTFDRSFLLSAPGRTNPPFIKAAAELDLGRPATPQEITMFREKYRLK